MEKAKYRQALPQMGESVFLTDGGIETTLIFHQGVELRSFAAFELVGNAAGRRSLAEYFAPYVALAREERRGLVLESATWRSNPEWGAALGFGAEELDRANAAAVEFLLALRAEAETAESPIVVSGCVGPRGDGYAPEQSMSAAEAEAYHARQVEVFAGAGADLVTAMTMTYPEEAIGFALAARAAGMPAVVSFTVETDGRLRSGHSLAEAIALCDAATEAHPAYYMVNCAHPTHFEAHLGGGAWLERIGGVRANASKMSHAELDEAPDLDDGDPTEFGDDYARLAALLPRLRVLGGCCGTDSRHVGAASRACRGGHSPID